MNKENFSRKKAQEQGAQIDISEDARAFGLIFTVFITSDLWNEWITPDQKSKENGENEKTRLNSLISNLVYALRMHRQTSKSNVINFTVSLNKSGNEEKLHVVSLLEKIDASDKRPCITILSNEEFSN